MKAINNISENFEHEVISKADYATFFHTSTWAQIIVENFPEYDIATRGFVLEDGSRAILPMLAKKVGARGFFKSYYSMIPGVYGGVIAERPLSNEELSTIYGSLMNAGTVQLIIWGNPYRESHLADGCDCRPRFTHVVDLEGGFERVLGNYNRGARSNTNKARKAGIQVSIATTLNEYKEYYAVYEETLKRWGDNATSAYPFGLFQSVFQRASKRGILNADLKLWVARLDERIIAGALIFYCNQHVVYWQGAALSDYFKYRANNLLQTEIIKHACEAAYKYYDFNPSGDNEGVVRFKESFGAERVEFKAYIWKNGKGYNLYEKIRTGLIDAAQRVNVLG